MICGREPGGAKEPAGLDSFGAEPPGFARQDDEHCLCNFLRLVMIANVTQSDGIHQVNVPAAKDLPKLCG